MADLLEIDGVNFQTEAFGASTRTGRYSMPAKRGENLVLPGASGAAFMKNKPFEEGVGALSVWAIGARNTLKLIAVNLATNPSVELNSTNWAANWFGGGTATGTTVYSKAGAIFGSLGMRKTWTVGSAGGGDVGAAYTMMNPTVGLIYNWSGHARASFATEHWSRVTFYNSSDAVITTVFAGPRTPSLPGDTARVSVTVVVPASTVKAAFTWGPYPTLGAAIAAGDTLDLDGVQITEGPNLLPYCDGSVAGAADLVTAWTGTPHASTTNIYRQQVIIPPTMQERRVAFESNMALFQRLFTQGHKLSTIRTPQPDGTTRRAYVEWKEWSDPEVQAGGTRAEWNIAYTIPNVFWEDETEQEQYATAGATLPKTHDLTQFAGMTGVIEDGKVAVRGPITNPRVTDAETGAWVQFTGNLGDNSYWVVDSATSTSLIGGTQSVIAQTTHSGSYRMFVLPNRFGLSSTPRLILSGTAGGANTTVGFIGKRKWVNG